MKQTKMVKFVFAIALLIPIVLVFVGIIQSVSLQIKRNNLTNSQIELELKEEELKEKQETLDYLQSEDYKNDHYSHEGYNNENYGNSGDIAVEIK